MTRNLNYFVNRKQIVRLGDDFKASKIDKFTTLRLNESTILYFCAMPIILKTITDEFQLGVWQVNEPVSYFTDRFTYSRETLDEIDQKHDSHRLQLLASRAVLYDMKLSGHGYKIVKDDHGKPHIINVKGDISFTHSHDHAAAIYSKTRLVGIDIQIATDKISRIAKKFVSDTEAAYIDIHANGLDYHHVLWGAKESLYKAYGRRKVEFRDHLNVDPFVYNDHGGHISGEVNMHDYKGAFDIYYHKIKDYYLVYCIEKNINETTD